jgi:hypothetical protein
MASILDHLNEEILEIELNRRTACRLGICAAPIRQGSQEGGMRAIRCETVAMQTGSSWCKNRFVGCYHAISWSASARLGWLLWALPRLVV